MKTISTSASNPMTTVRGLLTALRTRNPTATVRAARPNATVVQPERAEYDGVRAKKAVNAAWLNRRVLRAWVDDCDIPDPSSGNAQDGIGSAPPPVWRWPPALRPAHS